MGSLLCFFEDWLQRLFKTSTDQIMVSCAQCSRCNATVPVSFVLTLETGTYDSHPLHTMCCANYLYLCLKSSHLLNAHKLFRVCIGLRLSYTSAAGHQIGACAVHRLSKSRLRVFIMVLNAYYITPHSQLNLELPIFRVKSVKIYTGQKKFTRVFPWLPAQPMNCAGANLVPCRGSVQASD